MSQRMVPMQVLVLGICRTGTQSLADALHQVLDIGPIYHMRDIGTSNHADIWTTALHAKISPSSETKDVKHDTAFFDDFLGEHAGVSDIPAAIFYQELIAAYPSAKIILTTRDVDKWCESMQSTIIHAHLAKKANNAAETPMLQMAGAYHTYLWQNDFATNGKSAFERHNEGVLKAAKEAGRECLVYEVKEGWAPLCKFLGVKVPEGVVFPRSDDWAGYKREVAEKAAQA